MVSDAIFFKKRIYSQTDLSSVVMRRLVFGLFIVTRVSPRTEDEGMSTMIDL